MNINYDLTKEDYIEYNLHFISTSQSMKKSIFIQRYIISLIFLVSPFIAVKITNAPLTYWIVVFIVVYVLWVAFYVRFLKRSVKKRIEKLVAEGKNTNIFGNHSLTLTEEGIIETSSSGEAKTNWSAVEKVYDTEKYLYIYISSINAYIIPVRAFKSLDEKNEFLRKINDGMGKANEK